MVRSPKMALMSYGIEKGPHWKIGRAYSGLGIGRRIENLKVGVKKPSVCAPNSQNVLGVGNAKRSASREYRNR
jgi:hypothetical protein